MTDDSDAGVRSGQRGSTALPHTEREGALANRETWVRARETASGVHDLVVAEREELVLRREEVLHLREQALNLRREADTARLDRERLMGQLRDANEKLVVASLRSEEVAETEVQGRRRAETLANDLAASETALRTSEAQLRLLADTLPVLAWDAAPDGAVTWYNARWFEYTGTTAEDQVGWGWESVHDPQDLARVVAGWRRALSAGEPFEDTFRLRRHDGVFRWFLTRASPVRDHVGTIVRWLGTTVDVDAQTRAAELSHANDRAKDAFLAMLGHELRNPLAAVTSALDVMQLKAPDVVKRERTIIQGQIGQIVGLVDDLLDLSRIVEGKLQLHVKPVELAPIVARALETAGPTIRRMEHVVTVEVAPHGLVVDGDVRRLTQAVANVLANAAKYTPLRGTIAITATARDRMIVLRIRDTGIGISKDMLPRVFDLFSQEDRARQRSQGGLGLGLSLVQRLVTMHGGSVRAASDGVGCGTEIEIVLPASKIMGRHAVIATDGPALDARVLVVDDSHDAAEALETLLSMTGCDVRAAFDEAGALALAAEWRPDIVLLDLVLPGGGGYALAEKLRALAPPGEIRIVAITGQGRPSDLRRSEAAGFDGHLVKPVPFDTLVTMLRRSSGRVPRLA